MFAALRTKYTASVCMAELFYFDFFILEKVYLNLKYDVKTLTFRSLLDIAYVQFPYRPTIDCTHDSVGKIRAEIAKFYFY